MRRLVTSALLIMSIPVVAQAPASPTTLAQLRDRYRPLLLFAAAPDDPSLMAQLHRLKDAAPGLRERDILVIAVPFHNPAPSETSLTPADAIGARRRFHVAPVDFAVILLGKDGGEKLRSDKPIAFTKLRDTIDSMPMRQQEMLDHRKP